MAERNLLRDHMTWYLCYEQGLRSPNYPVPVVPLEVNIGSISVFFWEGDEDYPCKVIWKERT